MNRPFWTRTDRSEPDTCETLSSLISPYADGMASPDEASRVEGHLPSCPTCRQSLLWMQATRRALASRPLVLPPPDLRARIARSIAEADSAPPLLRPARVFTLRPAYAAAASLSVVAAFIGYGLLHTQPAVHVTPILPAKVATAPQITLPVPVKTVTRKSAAIKAMSTRTLLAQAKTHSQPEKVASRVSEDAPEMSTPDVTPTAPPIHTETLTPKTAPVVNTTVRVRPHALPHVKPTSPRAPIALVASSHVPTRPIEDKVPKADALETKHGDAVVASGKVPSVHVPIQVETAVVTNDPPPAVRTASASSGPLGSIQAYIHVHQTGYEHDLSLAGRTAIRTATVHTAGLTSGTEGSVAYQPFVSSP